MGGDKHFLLSDIIVLSVVLVTGPGDVAGNLPFVETQRTSSGEGHFELSKLRGLKCALEWFYGELIAPSESLF